MTEKLDGNQQTEDSELSLEELEAEIARLQILRESLGGAATTFANELLDMQNPAIEAEPETFEIFGGEESYWTIFRMFTIDKNQGRVWAIEDIWRYVAKNYDMSQETLDTLHRTLLEWSEDIKADAHEKGVKGRLLQHGNGYVFAPVALQETPLQGSIEEKAEVKRKLPRKTTAPTTSERKTPSEQLAYMVRGLIQIMPGAIARQADIKKEILKTYPNYDLSQLQDEIDMMALTETIYKFRRNKVAYLSLVRRPDEDEAPASRAEKRPNEDEIIDIDTAQKVLEVLCAPRRHVQQKIMINDLWRLVNGVADRSVRPPDREIEQLKKTCQQLQNKGLVVAASEKIGSGGLKTAGARSVKRYRSATRQVFKVGLTSQEVKKELQANLFHGYGVSTYVERLLSDR